jgi:hypothetical protein
LMAAAEGLEAHRNAVAIRRKYWHPYQYEHIN